MQSRLSQFTVKGTLKYSIDDDEFIDYLDRISKSFEEHKVTLTEGFVDEVVGTGGYATGYIAPLMSHTFNQYLYSTGADKDYWISSTSEGKSSIEVLYTGKDINKKYSLSKLDKGIWWEFAKDPSNPPRTRTLERDYSYFQETGDDELAYPHMAHHKGAIKEGLASVDERALTTVQEYLNCILEERWLYVTPPYKGVGR